MHQLLNDPNLTYRYKKSANLLLLSVSPGLGAGNGIFGASKSHSRLSLLYTSQKLDTTPSCTSCRAVCYLAASYFSLAACTSTRNRTVLVTPTTPAGSEISSNRHLRTPGPSACMRTARTLSPCKIRSHSSLELSRSCTESGEKLTGLILKRFPNHVGDSGKAWGGPPTEAPLVAVVFFLRLQ